MRQQKSESFLENVSAENKGDHRETRWMMVDSALVDVF